MNLECLVNEHYLVLSCIAERQSKVRDDEIASLSLQNIAEIVHLSRRKVNAIISELQKDGYILQNNPSQSKYRLTKKAVQTIPLIQKKGSLCHSCKRSVIFSFFSGCGFLDLGFEKTGFIIDFVNEYSPAFIEAYIYSRKKMKMPIPKYGYQNIDMNEYFNGRNEELANFIVDARKNNSLVGFIGGPPCPDFSIGGKNKGKEGSNGKLSASYIDLIKKMKPDFFLFENVKGLWRTKRHRMFYEELKSKLHKAGYCTVERLTNAIEFGVPQDRDRILLFGVKKTQLNKSFYKGSRLLEFPWNTYQKYNIEKVKKTSWPNTDDFIEDSIKKSNADIIKELTVQYWFDMNDVENHPNADLYFKPRDGLAKMQTIAEGDVSKKSYKRLHRWRYSPTAAYGNNEVHLHPYKARRISAAEALAIQSLPKEFEFPADMTLSDIFKTIGNGVPFLLSKAIAGTIQDYLEVAVCKG